MIFFMLTGMRSSSLMSSEISLQYWGLKYLRMSLYFSCGADVRFLSRRRRSAMSMWAARSSGVELR